MCSPVEGPRRTETSHVLIKSLELKCHVHIFLLYIYIYIYKYHIYINAFDVHDKLTKIHSHTYIYIVILSL